jgi:hypothetical protein
MTTTLKKQPKFTETEFWPVKNLIPYELNSKKHPPEQIAALARVIEAGGFDQPIIVDRYGVIIKGHGRRLAVMQLGWDTVEVKVLKHMTAEQAKAHRLTDNKVAQTDTDIELFRADLATLDDMSLLEGVFSDKELEYFAADLGEINDSAFVSDMAAVVGDQKKDVEKRLENVKGGRVPLNKAFGFKDLPVASQIVISNLMAKAEATTGLEGADAFVQWAETQLQASIFQGS